MEIISIAVSKLTSKIVNGIAAMVAQPIGDMLRYKSNITKLEAEANKLREKSDCLQAWVDQEHDNVCNLTTPVRTWKENVDIVDGLVKNILEKQAKMKKRWYPDPKTRYLLSRKSKNVTRDIAKLCLEGNFSRDQIARPSPLVLEPVSEVSDDLDQSTILTVSATTPDQAVELRDEFRVTSLRYSVHLPLPQPEIDSRMSITNDVMSALKNDGVNMIGIWGMGGIGKSTIAQEIFKIVQYEKLFDQVGIVEVSPELDITLIQDAIAESMGIKLEKTSQRARTVEMLAKIKGKIQGEEAASDSKWARKAKSILIILDSVWVDLALPDIGLPSPGGYKGYKVLVTTRIKDVCVKMNCQQSFEIPVLPREEALKLFWKTIDNRSDKLKKESVGAEIVDECGGLPIAIFRVAKTLAGKETYAWDDALQKLKSRNDIDGKTEACIELSYKHLEDKQDKTLFLLCCVFPEHFDIPIESLVRCAMGLNLVQGVELVSHIRNRVHSLVDKLRKSSLLLDGYKRHCVRMHDVVRSLGRKIASLSDNNQLISALQWYDRMNTNSHLLFQGLHQLQVVDHLPKKFPLQSLTTSPQLLQNLQYLSLKNCHLKGKDLSFLVEFQTLQSLSFAGSNIDQLPYEVGQLATLTVLDVSECRDLTIIPPRVLPRLKRLQEFHAIGIWVEWEIHGARNASLAELDELPCLKTLRIYSTDSRRFPEELLLKTLEKFQIMIGDFIPYHAKDHWDRDMYLFPNSLSAKLTSSASDHLESLIQALSRKSECLFLENGQYLKGLNGLNRAEIWGGLKSLTLKYCDQLEYVVEEEKSLWRGEGIAKGPLFKNLESLKIICCNKLKSIFPLSIAQGLVQLETLEINNCEMVTEIFPLDTWGEWEVSGKTIEMELPLKQLQLEELPSLTSFCHAVSTVRLPKLELLILKRVSDLIPSYNVAAQQSTRDRCLDKLVKSPLQVPKLTHIWAPGPHHCRDFTNIKELHISKCGSLTHVFPLTASGFPQLQNLQVSECWLIEEIVAVEESDKATTDPMNMVLFPKLIYFRLDALPAFKRICKRSYAFVWPSLEEVHVNLCPNMECHPFTFLVNAPKLKKGTVSECGKPHVEEDCMRKVALDDNKLIVSGVDNLMDTFCRQCQHDHPSWFSKLEDMMLQFCQDLPVPEQSQFVSKLLNLEEVEVSNSGSPQVMFDLQGPPNTQQGDDTQVFKRFKKLFLHELPNLTCIWMTTTSTSLGIKRFQNLTKLTISKCDGLCSLLSPSVGQNLVNLRELEVQSCSMVEEIMESSSNSGKETGIDDCKSLLPQLELIKLINLPSLKSFYRQGIRDFDLPLLKNMTIEACPLMTTFSYGTSMMHQESPNCNNYEQHNYFFKGKVVLTSFMKLYIIRVENLTEMWHGEVEPESMCNVEDLRIQFCPKLFNIFPSNLITRLEKLRELLLLHCDSLQILFNLEDIHQNVMNKQVVPICDRLSKLELRDLANLRHVLKKGPQKMMGFQSLASIEVTKCSKLRYLFSPSMAKLVVNLKRIYIFGCDMMEQVIGNQEDDMIADTKMVFPRLQQLQLKMLPNLNSFCREADSLNWPDLLYLDIIKCPELKSLISGVPNTPPHLFNEKVKLNGMKTLHVSELERLTHIWSSEKEVESCNLQVLQIRSCSNILNIFPSNMVTIMGNLVKLSISNCNCLQQLFNLEGVNLLEMKSLTSLEVKGCESLRYLFSPSMAKLFPNLEAMVIIDCKMMEQVIERREESITSTDIVMFPGMKRLQLAQLPNLIYFYDQMCAIGLPSLKKRVRGCPKLQTLVPGVPPVMHSASGRSVLESEQSDSGSPSTPRSIREDPGRYISSIGGRIRPLQRSNTASPTSSL